MITLEKIGDALKFTFSGNPLYLQDGSIELPLNSLLLVTDTSNAATFKRIDGDIFISATYDELGMTKSQLETWFKDNACSTSGGGGIPSGDVQTMIDQSISGMADNASYDSVSQEIKFYNGRNEVYSVDASDFVIDGMIDDVRIETISGVTCLVIDFNTASGKEDIQIPLTDIFDPSNYYTKAEVDAAVSGKADSSTVVTLSGEVSDMGEVTARALVDLQANKVDTSAITTSVTSASTDSEIPSAKAVWEAASGGGKAISAGTNISVTTGETADTVSCTLPLTVGSSNSSLSLGVGNSLNNSNRTFAIGDRNSIGNLSTNSLAGGMRSSISYNCGNSFAFGYEANAGAQYSFSMGSNTKTSNQFEAAFGRYNASNTGSTDADKTRFSVGNGTADNARHNAFEIRQNGDIYITSGGTDIKLQDNLGGGGGGGGNATVELTQAEYDALVSAGTVSADTYYIITDATEIDISQYWTSAQTTSAITEAVSGKVNTSSIVTAITSGSTDSQVPSAKAVYDTLGGLKLQQITQADYDALVQAGTVDASTLYIITNVVS